MDNDIAIIAHACRFPESPSIASFWENLTLGRNCISTFSKETCLAEGVASELLDDPNYVRALGFVENIRYFDNNLFKITPAEARIMDPQHRVMLEMAYELLSNLKTGSKNIGVFMSCSTSRYWLKHLFNNPLISKNYSDYEILIANAKDMLSTRLSYRLNLTGPSININTACSSGLVSVHYGCQALLNYDCDLALVGAVSLHTLRKEGYLFLEGGNFSRDGICRPFDKLASGFVGGNGAAALLLKRKEDAVADGDYILSVIKSSAVNNDGNRKAGFTAPSPIGQAQVIRMALELAETSPESVSYVETHGTATRVGDPIEIMGLSKAFNLSNRSHKTCKIGSVKSNIGHLDTCSGLAGLIKTSLCLENKTLVPTINFTQLNPAIELNETPFEINLETCPWESDTIRKAGVSAFGVGGTNAHVILEEYVNSVQKPEPKTLTFNRNSFWVDPPHSAKTDHKKESVSLKSEKSLKTVVLESWQETLGVDAIQETDDFFDLGGDSFQAVMLCEKLSKSLSLKIDPQILLQAATLVAFTAKIESMNNQTSLKLVTVIKEGDKALAPIVCIHPVGGNTFMFKSLLPFLEEVQNPVLTIRSQGAIEGETPLNSIEEMAKTYLTQLNEVATIPPAIIIGYSLGGVIAWEMVSQLDNDTTTLFMVDTPAPENLPDYAVLKKSLSNITQTQEHIEELEKINYGAMKAYVPGKVSNSIVFFKATNYDKLTTYVSPEYWNKKRRGVKIFTLDGDHFNLFTKKNAANLSTKIVEIL